LQLEEEVQMLNYAQIKDDKIIGMCNVPFENILNIEVSDEIYNNYLNNPDMYIWDGLQVVVNPNYEAEQELKERERVNKLTCTKRVFALMLQELGITYAQLKELIASNEQAQLEWDLCVELERGNPLLDVMAFQLGITSAQLDGLFKYANGEITLEQFKGLI
jgi:hypothetical protein